MESGLETTCTSNPPFRFRTAVLAEMRATWFPRRRLWLSLAVVMVLLAAFGPVRASTTSPPNPLDFFTALGLGIWMLAGWGSAWLCSDLLSLKFPGNPDPLREWRPREFLARAAGRLAPLYALVLVVAAVFAARSLLGRLMEPAGGGTWSHLDGFNSPLEAPVWHSGWTLAVVTSGLPYAAGAALLSATARRPRRWLVAPAAAVLGTMLACGALYVLARLAGSDGLLQISPELVPAFAAAPGFSVAAFTFLPLEEALLGVCPGPTFLVFVWVAVVAMPLYALPPFLMTWWVAARRYRRHRSTQRSEPAGVLPEAAG